MFPLAFRVVPIIAALGMPFVAHAATPEIPAPSFESAIVQEKTLVTVTEDARTQQQSAFRLQMTSGDQKGQTITITQDPTQNPYQLEPKTGDRVIVQVQKDPIASETHYFLDGFDRTRPLLVLVLGFILTLVLLSGWQGLKTSGSILLSVGLIGFVLIPAFLKGLNPVPIAIGLSTLFSAISSGVSMGWNRKALATTIGTLGGTCLAWFIGSLVADWAHLRGANSEEDRLFFAKNPTLDPGALFLAGLIIAAMGVIEDVAVSIASGAAEVKRALPNANRSELFHAGISVGRDHVSALANTLIFAYVGASISTLLLFQQSGNSWARFFSTDDIATEIIRALAATIGLILTVPLTAWLSAKLFQDQGRQSLDRPI